MVPTQAAAVATLAIIKGKKGGGDLVIKILAEKWSKHEGKFREIGRGGEAVVYQIKPDTAAKLFLEADAPEYKESKMLQEAAKVRIDEMQTKLYDFPSDLPETVVAPSGVLENKSGRIFGYTMPYIKAEPIQVQMRKGAVITDAERNLLLVQLYDTLVTLHSKGVVVGDFNENNILVENGVIRLIDADSFQFGRYLCRTFMPTNTAPELMSIEKVKVEESTKPMKLRELRRCCDTHLRQDQAANEEVKRNSTIGTKTKDVESLRLSSSHTQTSDWYSFVVLVMKLYTRTTPYGGTVDGLSFLDRLQKKITIFDPRVVYPVMARPMNEVPRGLVELFARFFHYSERYVPSRDLFAPSSIPMTPINQEVSLDEQPEQSERTESVAEH